MLIIDMDDRMNPFENPELNNIFGGQVTVFDQNMYSSF